MPLKISDNQAKREWDNYLKGFLSSVSAELNESEADRKRRIERLESNFEEWKKYYFPKYCFAPSASFHKRASKRIFDNPEWYEVRKWARELAKDAVCMMETLNQALTGEKKNIILVSNSWDKAADFLEPYRKVLAENERIINDYGVQENPGSWTYGDFTTVAGASFLAIGAGQSPRGSRNEEVRPNKIIISDIDTDEDVRNPDIIDKRWGWLEKALYPTRSISIATQYVFLGNLIAKDCCIARASKMADFVDTVNIVDRDGKSSWPEKNTDEHVRRIRGSISTASFEAEYMNNPLSEGDVFKEMRWDKVPPLNKFRFLIYYTDPSTANSKNKKGSYKAGFLVGYLAGAYYIITGYLDHVTNAEFVEWFYSIKAFVGDKTQGYNYIENNTLQDPFYEQVIVPLIQEAAKTKGYVSVIPDTRSKPDKFSRIEGNLEPLNREGKLILNEAQAGNPHMKRLEEQFKLLNAQMKSPADGPDAVEGAVFIINQKIAQLAPDAISIIRPEKSSKRI